MTSLGWWCGAVAAVLAGAKAIVFGYSTAHLMGSLLVNLTCVVAALELIMSSRTMAARQRRQSLAKLLSEVEAAGTSTHGGGASATSSKFAEKLKVLLEPGSTSMFAVWQILRPYFWPSGCTNKVRTSLTFIIVGGSKACTLLAPLYIGAAAQTLAERRVPYKELAMYCGLQFGSKALAEAQKLVYIGVKQHAFAEIAETTFRHLLGLSLDWHLRKKMGEVIRVQDRGISSADSVMNYLVLFLGPSIVEFAVILVVFFVHFNSPALSAVTFLSFVIYVTLTIQLTQWRKKFRAGQNKQDNKYHDIATDALVNFETVKYFANEHVEIGQFKTAVKAFQNFNVGVQASLSLLNSSQQLNIQLTALIALCLASTTILHLSRDPNQPVEIGDFVSVNVYVIQLFAPLSFLGTIYGAVVQAFIDMRNLSSLLQLSPDVSDRSHAPALKLADAHRGARVEFQSVDFSYPTQQSRGLRQVSFVTPPGTITALVGPTGAGKSTISRLLFRFYDVDSGSILVDGQNVSHVTQRSLRGAIGVVPQDTVLFNSSIAWNIGYGNPAAGRAEIEAAAERAQIRPFIEQLEQGWDTAVGERGLRLSGGEKQRVAIARCLLKDPPIVLLDEATSALDSSTEQAVQDALEKLGTGRTQLVVAHRLSTIAGAHQILVLEAGRIVELGTHAALLEKDGLYANLWNTQQEAATRAAAQA